MSGIERVKARMKEQLSCEPSEVERIQQKGRRTIYSLTREDHQMLRRIFSHRLSFKSRTSIPSLMSEAIQLLHIKEFTGDQ